MTVPFPKLPIIFWSWGGKFPDDHLARTMSMVSRNLTINHRFVVISDSKATRERFKDEAQVVPLWSDLHNIGGKCFVRLKAFDKSFRDIIPEPRWAWLDIDMVAVDNIDNIFGRKESFLMSGVELGPQPVNGSLVIANHGVAPEIFDEFNINEWRNEKARLRYGGSDQAWIAIKANKKITKITRDDGLFCYRDDICPRHMWGYESWRKRNLVDALKHEPTGGAIPKGARLIQMNGPHSQWSDRTMRLSPWVAKFWPPVPS